MDRNNHYNQALKSEGKEDHQLGDMKKCAIDERAKNDNTTGATYPYDGFSITKDLTELLSHVKLSPGPSSSTSKISHNSLSSILHDKRIHKKAIKDGLGECRENFFSGSTEDFNRGQNKEDEIKFPEILYNDDELKLKLDSFSGPIGSINSQIDDQRFSNYDGSEGKNQANLSDEISPELVPRGCKESWTRSRNPPSVKVSTSNTETIEWEQGAQDVIDHMKEYLDDMQRSDSPPKSRSLGLEDYDSLNRTETRHSSGDTILPQDVINYLEGPEYLDDLYGLPSLLEALKHLPSTSQMNQEQLKALRRLQSIQAHISGMQY